MTAHALQRDKDLCLAAGMDGFVTKPIRVEQLMNEIERALHPASRREAAEVAPTPAPQPTAAFFDRAGTLERLGDDAELLREVAAIYTSSAPGQLEDIAAALGRGALQDVYREAHSLKGATATFEAPTALKAVTELEACGRRGDAAAAAAAFESAKALVTALVATLEPLTREGAPVA